MDTKDNQVATQMKEISCLFPQIFGLNFFLVCGGIISEEHSWAPVQISGNTVPHHLISGHKCVQVSGPTSLFKQHHYTSLLTKRLSRSAYGYPAAKETHTNTPGEGFWHGSSLRHHTEGSQGPPRSGCFLSSPFRAKSERTEASHINTTTNPNN